MGNGFSEVYKLLNLAEDYLRDGFRSEHPPLENRELRSVPAPSEQLERIAGQVRRCTRCGLHRERTRAVPGEGVLPAMVMVIGEGPGLDEDRSGRPFVGRTTVTTPILSTA